MHAVPSFLLVITVAAVGGFIGTKLKLPAGAMLGAMIATVIMQMIFEQPALPQGLRVVLQLASGILIGSRVAKKDAIGLKRLALPVIVLITCMLIINIVVGTTMYQFSYLDIATSLFASAPGGLMDMTLISSELGANSAYVALLQLSRLIFIFTCMVPFYRKIAHKVKNADMTKPLNTDAKSVPQTTNPMYRLCITVLCGCTSGLILWRFGVPAGAIIGAMLGTAICNVVTGKAYFPPRARLPLQIVAGAFIGLRMDRDSIFAMGNLIVPVLILFAGVVFITFATAFVMRKLTGLDFATCVLASTPGGLTEMSLLADDLGLDTPKIAILQTSRLMSVIIFFPTMLYFVLRLMR